MAYVIPFDEDAYWERRREEFENPPPYPEGDGLFFDDDWLDDEDEL